jgi:hypothetical protein
MSNRDCNGDYFVVGATRMYACFWDSTVVMADDDLTVCPHCARHVDASDAGRVETYTRTFANVNGRTVSVPVSTSAKEKA